MGPNKRQNVGATFPSLEVLVVSGDNFPIKIFAPKPAPATANSTIQMD